MHARVQYPESIEPLVQFIETTPPSEIVDRTLEKLRAGIDTKTMLTASALAVVRSSDLPPGHRGGPLHPLAGLHAITNLVDYFEGEESFPPILQYVALSNKHINDPVTGPFSLLEFAPLDPSGAMVSRTADLAADGSGHVITSAGIQAAKDAFLKACRRGEGISASPMPAVAMFTSDSLLSLLAEEVEQTGKEVAADFSDRREKVEVSNTNDLLTTHEATPVSRQHRRPACDYRCGFTEEYADDHFRPIRTRRNGGVVWSQYGGRLQRKDWRRSFGTNRSSSERGGTAYYSWSPRETRSALDKYVRTIACTGRERPTALQDRTRRNEILGREYDSNPADPGNGKRPQVREQAL